MKLFQKKVIHQMEPWHPDYDMTNVSISAGDQSNGSPKLGDYIASNPKNPYDRWLVAEDLLKENYVEVQQPTTFLDRLVIEKQELDEKLEKLEAFFDTETYKNLDKFDQELLCSQEECMEDYSEILHHRITRANQVDEKSE